MDLLFSHPAVPVLAAATARPAPGTPVAFQPPPAQAPSSRGLAPRHPLPTSGIPATTRTPAPTAAVPARPAVAARPLVAARPAVAAGLPAAAGSAAAGPPASVSGPPRLYLMDGRRSLLNDARRQAALWCRRHRTGGDGAVAAARKRAGTLTRAQELTLLETIRDRFPDQLELAGALWSRQTVAALAERLFKTPLSPAATTRYLRSWGLTAREPVDRACPLCAAAVVRWQAEQYPAICRTAQKQRAELCWVGKTRLHGVTPAIDVVAAMSARGRVRFMATTEAELSRDFLTRLRPPSGRPTHVVVDGSWTLTEWPRRVPDGVVLHALPSCERGR